MKFKFSERERIIFLASLLVLILYFVCTYLYFPKFNEIAKLSLDLSKMNIELKTVKEKALLLQSLEAGTVEDPRIKKTREEQTIEALKYLSSVISESKLDLISIKPRPEEVIVSSAKAILFDIELIGSYNDVYGFMRHLEKLPILILIDSANLKRGDKSLVVMSVVLSVYY